MMGNNKITTGKKFEVGGVRYYFVIMGFLGFVVNFAVRTTLNVAIVAMVNGTAVYNTEDQSRAASQGCGNFSNNTIDPHVKIRKMNEDGEFVWSPKQQGVLLGAFYYGYILLQIPGGRAAEMYSGKWVFGFGTLIPCLLSLLIPATARFHYAALIALRALQGLTQGVIFGSYFSMMSHWFPDSERGLFLSFTYGGINVGIIGSMTVTGFLCSSQFFGGWPSAFYVMGSFGCIWFIVWCIAVTDTPHSHAFITEWELNYIISNQQKNSTSQLPPFPWLKVMRSVPFWSVVICAIGFDWGANIMLSELPTFIATILHFDIKMNGLLSSLPNLLTFIFYLIVGAATDYLIRKHICSVKHIRKFSVGMSHIGSTVLLLGVVFSGCNVTACIVFLMGYNMLFSFGGSGHNQSTLDFSPEYAGTLHSIINTFSSITGFVTPYFIGSLTQEHQTMKQWQIIFGVSAAIQLVSGLIFILFSTTENQKWTEDEKINSQSNLLQLH